MKTFITIIIIGLVVYFGIKLATPKPDASVSQATVTEAEPTPEAPTAAPVDISGKQIDNSKVTVGFTGFGPGKKHVGSFSSVTSNLTLSDKGTIGGKIVVNMNNFSTDTEKVTAHLKTADFFDVAKYPTATFVVTKDNTLADLSKCGPADICEAAFLSGNFTIHGVTKNVSFPVIRSTDKLTANFTLNLKEFGIDQTFANETVELNVAVSLK